MPPSWNLSVPAFKTGNYSVFGIGKFSKFPNLYKLLCSTLHEVHSKKPLKIGISDQIDGIQQATKENLAAPISRTFVVIFVIFLYAD